MSDRISRRGRVMSVVNRLGRNRIPTRLRQGFVRVAAPALVWCGFIFVPVVLHPFDSAPRAPLGGENGLAARHAGA